MTEQEMLEGWRVPPGLAIIIPSHNRCEVTVRGIGHLVSLGLTKNARVILVDDGSWDGTADRVEALYPEVTVLRGTGNLYWAGAIALGMRHAMELGVSCMVWLNDDSHPHPGAVERVAQAAMQNECIAGGFGQVRIGEIQEQFYLLYKGRFGLDYRVAPDGSSMVEADACRGNLVAIPKMVVERIGYPDAANLPQYFADTDYVLRAREAGLKCLVLLDAFIDEREHSGDWNESWLCGHRSPAEIWGRFRVRQSGLYWKARWVYLTRHWGLAAGGLSFLSPYLKLSGISIIRAIVPAALLRRLCQKGRSGAQTGAVVPD